MGCLEGNLELIVLNLDLILDYFVFLLEASSSHHENLPQFADSPGEVSQPEVSPHP